MRAIVRSQEKLFVVTYGIDHEDKSYVSKYTVAAMDQEAAKRAAQRWAEDFFEDEAVHAEEGGRCYVTSDGYERICVDSVDEFPTCEMAFKALEIKVGGRPEIYRRPELKMR